MTFAYSIQTRILPTPLLHLSSSKSQFCLLIQWKEQIDFHLVLKSQTAVEIHVADQGSVLI